jgi:hypothetical protein
MCALCEVILVGHVMVGEIECVKRVSMAGLVLYFNKSIL